ncbi:MAG: hypothetical protein GY764_09960 [Halieaceae bacterium]|nr:hypothetical protein [Halieaceae bacterium]
MRVSDIFHGDSLKAADLKEKDVTLTIEGWALKEFETDGRADKKIELRFTETDRTLVLNKTNAGTIVELLSEDDLDRWVGASVTIFPTHTDYAGKRVACIRVKAAFREETPADSPF